MEKPTLIKALKLSYVPRWVIIDMLKPQTVSDHVYRTQVIVVQLIEKLELSVEKESMVYQVLFHDIEEGETGDIPSTFKAVNHKPEPSPSPNVTLLKLADTIEAAIWLHRYGKNPHRVRRFLEAKILFLQEELVVWYDLSSYKVSEVINNLIDVGRSHD